MSDTPNSIKRPLSPHLQVYRLPYNALMSIAGRAVGIGLSIVMLVLCGWLVAVVWNPAFYDQSLALIETPYTKYAFLALAFLVFFYIGNGVRHVLWDMGVGVNEKAGIATGNIVLLLAAIATFGLWYVSCGCHAVQDKTVIEGEQNAG